MADEIVKEENKTSTAQTLPTNEERIQQINNMYQASLDSQKANLEATYQQNLSNAQANKAQIDTSYGEQKNQLASEYERQRRNNNMQAMNNGLNTGAGSQMQLAQTANYQSNAAKLSKAQAQANTEADRNLADITTNYQLQVNQAVANNDYQKAAALLDEYNNQKSDMNQQAQTLAAYGNFTGYAQMYGQETADSMQKAWQIQKPALAYNLGQITADQYKSITGQYPVGFNAGGGGYGGYGGYTPPPAGGDYVEAGKDIYYVDGDNATYVGSHLDAGDKLILNYYKNNPTSPATLAHNQKATSTNIIRSAR